MRFATGAGRLQMSRIKSDQRKVHCYRVVSSGFCSKGNGLMKKYICNVSRKCISLGSDSSLPLLVIMFRTSTARVIEVDHVNR